VFENIVGQENAKKALRLMIESGRMHHTLLFAGPYGVGKGETALELARMLLCENDVNSVSSTTGRACTSTTGYACGSCVRASKIEHPDLHLLFPYKALPKTSESYDSWLDGLVEHRKRLAEESYAPIVYEKGRQIVVGTVAEVQERLQESSFEGGRKVCVVLGADRFNNKTANSLLKILEEPPRGVHFILTTESLSSVLPTIVSRASIIRFRRLKVNEIEAYLENAGITDPGKRHTWALDSEGSIKTAKAFAFYDKTDIHSQAFEIYTSVALGDSDDVVSHAFPFVRSRNFLETEELVLGFAQCTRSILKAKAGMKPVESGYSGTIEKLSLSTDIPSLHRLSVKLEECLDMLRRNVNISLALTTLYYEIYDTYRKRQYQ
jgi:DNA polymerase III delta prime subunit